jgi:hypothetical protein
MARYKEIWNFYDDPTVIGYIDTEKGCSIPLDPGNGHYQEFLTWADAGGVADPAYTADEIAAAEAAQAVAEAEVYLRTTADLVQRYRDDLAAGRRPYMPESKYCNLLKKRARAQKKTAKSFANFTA